jgi:hypothetical protein
MQALDSSEPTIGMASTIASKGNQAVGVYLRPDRCSAAMIAELHHANLQIWAMYEKGFPIHDRYFSGSQGLIDGHAAAAFAAQAISQPNGTLIYACVDYDPDHDDENGPTIRSLISDYMSAFRSAIAQAGYVAGVYGSGRTCRILMDSGLAASGWLSISKSFAEYADFRPRAAIVQTSVMNKSWDADSVQDPAAAGLW